MMGQEEKQPQGKLFYTGLNLEARIRKDHLLRKIKERIDFDFIYDEVRDRYGYNGNVSVPPPLILKMLLLLILYNVRSERELMATIPERLDWLWFLGYDLDDEIPSHSVLSKARARWGAEVFKAFFERIVWQCVEAGLVDGSKLYMDSSLVQADASNNSVIKREALSSQIKAVSKEVESRLEDMGVLSSGVAVEKSGKANRSHISKTDPDASVVRQGRGSSKLQYKVHRGVDERCEVITTTEVTPGETNEAHLLTSLLSDHQQNTGLTAEAVVADSKYGTIENYLVCHDRGVRGHFKALKTAHQGSGRQKGIFPQEAFTYHRSNDTFTCPAGQTLKKRNYNKNRQHFEYKAPAGVCRDCKLRQGCTRSQYGRSLKRHIRQDDLDIMFEKADSRECLQDLKQRQHLMERSFAQAVRYGFKRARWRRLWRVGIQEYLICAVQNIMVLIRHTDLLKPTAFCLAKMMNIIACPLSVNRISSLSRSMASRMLEARWPNPSCPSYLT